MIRHQKGRFSQYLSEYKLFLTESGPVGAGLKSLDEGRGEAAKFKDSPFNASPMKWPHFPLFSFAAPPVLLACSLPAPVTGQGSCQGITFSFEHYEPCRFRFHITDPLLSIRWDDSCPPGLGCFADFQLMSCSDPGNACINGVTYRECGTCPYTNQLTLAGWEIILSWRPGFRYGLGK